ncbi:DUF459 domain-containing protein [Nocardia inohanensis]|uniref:DUF459 domain-containing protein n=1 Tax=Nocardia inohanensis TaxID=209246 RepID=UPI000830F87C|nr:GDSL-type esterase/lipase family protein [Nocardia inohanensis]
MRDVRVCFVGESYVAGVGDPRGMGWAGRLAARAEAAGQPLVHYNLGIKREDSNELRARWASECARRLPAGADCRVVVSTGANDTQFENGRRRVDLATSLANLTEILDTARARGWRTLVVSPPPNVDEEHNSRLIELGDGYAQVCERAGVPFVRVHETLRASPTWMADVRAGDGYHPGADGYAEFAELVAPQWLGWLAETGSGIAALG